MYTGLYTLHIGRRASQPVFANVQNRKGLNVFGERSKQPPSRVPVNLAAAHSPGRKPTFHGLRRRTSARLAAREARHAAHMTCSGMVKLHAVLHMCIAPTHASSHEPI